MKKMLKFSVVFVVIVAMILGGAVYYASQKINPEQVRNFLVAQIEKSLPGASTKLQQVEYKLGTSIRFRINNLEIFLKSNRPGKNLFSVNQADISIPLWAIIMGGGNIDVEIKEPNVSYFEYKKDSNNWTEAAGDKGSKNTKAKSTNKKSKEESDQPKTNTSVKSETDKILIPAFLSSSLINIRLDNIKVNYQTISEMKGEFVVSKLILKKLGAKTNAAYEINSNIKLAIDSKTSISTNLLLIGQFETPLFFNEQKIQTNAVLNLKDIDVEGQSLDIPNLKTEFKLESQKGESNVSLISSLGQLLELNSNILHNEKDIKVNLTKFNIDINGLANMLKVDLGQMLASENTLQLNGQINYSSDKLDPNLKANVDRPIQVKWNGQDIKIFPEIVFKGNDINADIEVKAFDGTTKIQAAHKVNDYLKIDMNKLNLTTMSVNSNDMILSREFIRSNLYSKKSNKTEDDKTQKTPGTTSEDAKENNNSVAKENKAKDISFPPVNLKLNLKNIKIDQEELALESLIKVNKDTIGTKNLNVKLGSGKVGSEFLSVFGKSETKHTFKTELNDINLSFFNPFLPPVIKEIVGKLSGKIEGNLQQEQNDQRYFVKVDAGIVDGELKGINLKDKVTAIVEKVPPLKKAVGKKPIEIDDKFDKLQVKADLKDSHYKIHSFDFIGINNNISMKGNGDVYPINGQEGSIVVDLKDNKGELAKKMKREVGTDILPLRFIGPGFDLKPDYTYTLEKLAKVAVKTKGKKAAKKAVNKVTDKLLKGKSKEAVEKLFKGLFK